MTLAQQGFNLALCKRAQVDLERRLDVELTWHIADHNEIEIIAWDTRPDSGADSNNRADVGIIGCGFDKGERPAPCEL